MSVAVLSSTGQKLMPTSNYRARKLLKSKRATIECYHPIFTIRLTSRKEGNTQPIEYACDTGYQHVGVSIKSEKHEFVHAQYDMLNDETKRHNACRRYRRARRNKLRYRKPRFDSRSKKNKEMAPSLRHRMENQIRLFESFCKVMPITAATFEMGKFDTQLLQAIADGRPLPEGKDYQHGSKYLYQTEREAVFGRDHYTCQVCGRSVKDGAILHTHHIGFWKNYRSNRISNLLTVCEHCHTAKNHKPGGKLWGLEPMSTNLAPAAYMSTVRWSIYRELVLTHPEVKIRIQYGAKTAVTRKSLHLAKTHANDAYCIGTFHPRHRTRGQIFQKQRRNNRVLTTFHDAQYIDIRDGKQKSGSQLSCGRLKRRESRRTDKNERIYRGVKCQAGSLHTRKRRYDIQAGDVVIFHGRIRVVKGTHHSKKTGAENVEFKPDGLLPKSTKPENIITLHKKGGWCISSRE